MTTPRQSMTGFGRTSGDMEIGSWSIEAKSVNGRGLDVRVNLPPGLDMLETVVREAAKKRFARGSVQVSVRVDMRSTGEVIEVDDAALEKVISAWQKAMGGGEVARPVGATLAQLMALKGVVVATTGAGLRGLATDEAALRVLATGLVSALDGLARSRFSEGAEIAELLVALLDQMVAQVAAAEAEAGQVPGQLKAKIEARIGELGGLDKLDPGRLEAEIAILASKADVREEIDRLKAHIESGRGLLREPGSIGRKLDFLSQELMREANTLCSKSTSLTLTEYGLALKAIIDQFKEQAANVE